MSGTRSAATARIALTTATIDQAMMLNRSHVRAPRAVPGCSDVYCGRALRFSPPAGPRDRPAGGFRRAVERNQSRRLGALRAVHAEEPEPADPALAHSG